MKNAPTITVDHCDNGSIYLSGTSLETQVLTSKCGSINVNVPKNDDMVEFALPETIKHSFEGGNIKSEIIKNI